MSGLTYHDRAGDEITLEQYLRLFGDDDYKRVESTDVGPYWVSTVWLGLNHNFWEGPPLIFETMVFATGDRDDEKDRGLREFDVHRWSTEEAARAGHGEIVTLVRATLQEEPDMTVPEKGTNGH